MDKSSANHAGLENINLLLLLAGWLSFIGIIQVKYMNNIIEQDYRLIKKITRSMMGFKAFYSAKATLDGVETVHMIHKRQLTDENIPAYQQFMALAG
jgi:putative transposase